MGGTREVHVVFHTHGFEVGKEITEAEWEKLQAQFMVMYGTFCDTTNPMMEKLNDIWHSYEEMKAINKEAAERIRKSMDCGEDPTYCDWIEHWFDNVVKQINEVCKLHNYRLRGMIFRDGDLPIFGARVVGHPKWTMDFTLKDVEE